MNRLLAETLAGTPPHRLPINVDLPATRPAHVSKPSPQTVRQFLGIDERKNPCKGRGNFVADSSAMPFGSSRNFLKKPSRAFPSETSATQSCRSFRVLHDRTLAPAGYDRGASDYQHIDQFVQQMPRLPPLVLYPGQAFLEPAHFFFRDFPESPPVEALFSLLFINVKMTLPGCAPYSPLYLKFLISVISRLLHHSTAI